MIDKDTIDELLKNEDNSKYKTSFFTIYPTELNIENLYEFLINNCKFFDVVLLTAMLNQSKELIEEMYKLKEGK